MRILSCDDLVEPVAELCERLSRELPEDVQQALLCSRQRESSPRACQVLDLLLANLEVARRESVPMCQDTGMVVVFVAQGEELCLEGNLQAAIDEGVRQGYQRALLRKSVLAHPLRRDSNTGDNTPAVVHLERRPGDRLTLHLAAKGGGSENMSALWMLPPSQGREGVVATIVERVKQAGGRPCPPLVLGVGLGGNFETCALLAKQALLRPLGQPAPDPELANLEREILARVNATGIGPLGLGGDTTALAVHAIAAPCHLATLPVALNVQCHAARHGTVVI